MSTNESDTIYTDYFEDIRCLLMQTFKNKVYRNTELFRYLKYHIIFILIWMYYYNFNDSCGMIIQ